MKRTMPVEQDYWTPERFSECFGVSVPTLYRWRYLGVGPRAIKVGGKIRYPESSVREWLDSLEAAEGAR